MSSILVELVAVVARAGRWLIRRRVKWGILAARGIRRGADPNSPMGRAHVVLQVKLAELDHLIGERPSQPRAIADAVIDMREACDIWLVRLVDWSELRAARERKQG